MRAHAELVRVPLNRVGTRLRSKHRKVLVAPVVTRQGGSASNVVSSQKLTFKRSNAHHKKQQPSSDVRAAPAIDGGAREADEQEQPVAATGGTRVRELGCLQASCEADEGTRTLDLLHGKRRNASALSPGFPVFPGDPRESGAGFIALPYPSMPCVSAARICLAAETADRLQLSTIRAREIRAVVRSSLSS